MFIKKINEDETISIFDDSQTTKVFNGETVENMPTCVFTGTPDEAQAIVDQDNRRIEKLQELLAIDQAILNAVNS